MDKQPTPINIWHTMADANVELFRARMNFSAEMFDICTKWPRQSFSDATEALKAAHLDSLKLLEARKTATPAAKVKAKPKKAKPAAKKKTAAPKPAVTATVKVVTPKFEAAKPVPAPQPAEAAKPEVKAAFRLAPVPTAPESEAPKPEAPKPEAMSTAPTPATEAARPAVKTGAKPVTLPDMPDFSAKPRPPAPAEPAKPAETPTKEG